jgi:uncharacterized protein with PIN domain
MKQASVRFYGSLNDFLPPARRAQAISCSFDVSGSVKDMIEALGVPHTEVALIVANGQSVDFSYQVQNGDNISVYPDWQAVDISPLIRLRPQPSLAFRFVADGHLGRLTAYLRMAGFDTLYRSDYSDEDLAGISSNENRILLTRDRGLLKRNRVTRGYYVRATDPRRQLPEVLRRFDLLGSLAPFQRCVHCNALLQSVPKELISDRLQPETKQHFDEFSICPACARIYWKGSHYRRMQRFLATLISTESETA